MAVVRIPRARRPRPRTTRRGSPEADFQRDVDAWLERQGLFPIPLNSGEAVTRAARVAGIPDRLVIVPGGRAVFLELKRPDGKGRKRPEQKAMLARLNAIGAVAVFAKSIDEVAAALMFAGWRPMVANG